MRKEIDLSLVIKTVNEYYLDKKVLNLAIKTVNEYYSLCSLDTVVRIGNDSKKMYGCKDCVYKEVADICPELIKKDIKGILKLR